MKNYDVIAKTANLLNSLTKDLKERLDNQITDLSVAEGQFALFSKSTTDGNIEYYQHIDGEKCTCSRWDYNYAEERVQEQEAWVKAYEAIIKHLEDYKF